jgi:group I intron endonuclease
MVNWLKLSGNTVSYIQKSVLPPKLLKFSYPKAERERKYSTQVSFLDSKPSKPNLDKDSLSPGFITGFSDGSCKALVIRGSPGSLGSSVGLGKFNKLVNNIIKFTPFHLAVITGLLLGDGWLIFSAGSCRKNTKHNARLGFAQSMDHFEYFWFVFTILSPFCSSLPHSRNRTRFGKLLFGVEFFTRSLPCFTQLYNLFYVNGVKQVPVDIYNLLTPVALAHWIMASGFVHCNGLILCCNSYSIKDVTLLINVLITRHRLDCILITDRDNQYHIYIGQRSMPLLRSKVGPYMHSSMLYKLYNKPASSRYTSSIVENQDSSLYSVVPVLVYPNADTLKQLIIKNNRGKSGVYRWVNIISGRNYIGSSVNLGKRFINYYNYNHLSDPKCNMLIYKAVLKYGYSNFKLEILEYCNQTRVLDRENFYLKLVKPEYNILEKAGSSLGYKHTEETKYKMRVRAKGRIFSAEIRAKLRESAINRTDETKAKYRAHLAILNLSKGKEVKVTNIETKTTTVFESIRKAAIELNTNHSTLRRCILNQNLFKDIYEIKAR